jgi:hypothetical protein
VSKGVESPSQATRAGVVVSRKILSSFQGKHDTFAAKFGASTHCRLARCLTPQSIAVGFHLGNQKLP